MNFIDSPYVKPQPDDVLLTDGEREINTNHEGNVNFLKLIVREISRSRDDLSPTKTLASTKRVLQRKVTQNPTGRFLKQAMDDDRKDADSFTFKPRWEVMSHGEALAVSWSYINNFLLKVYRSNLKKRKRKEKEKIEQSSEGIEKIKTVIKGSEKINRTNRVVIEIESDGSFCENNDTVTNYSESPNKSLLLSNQRPDTDGSITPHPHDVLIYDDEYKDFLTIRRHDGNKLLDKTVKLVFPEYKKATDKDELDYATAIYSIIRDQNPAGRFLRWSDASSVWSRMRKGDITFQIKQRLDSLSSNKQVKYRSEPNPQDFLFGDEGQLHIGNKLFYEVMAKYKFEYVNEKRHNTSPKCDLRSKYAFKILSDFGSVFATPGLFLRRCEDSKLWYDVGSKEILKETIKKLSSPLMNNDVESKTEGSQKAVDSQNIPNSIPSQKHDKAEICQLNLSSLLQQHKPQTALKPLRSFPNVPISKPEIMNQHLQQNDRQRNYGPSTQNTTALAVSQIGNLTVQHSTQNANMSQVFVIRKTPMQTSSQNTNTKTTGPIQMMQNPTPNTNTSTIAPMGLLASVPVNDTINTAQNDHERLSEWRQLNRLIENQMKQMELKCFQARQLKEKAAVECSNSEGQLRLCENYRKKIHEFQKQFQPQQNVEQQRQTIYILTSKFQIQSQELHIQQQQQIIQQQNRHRKEIQLMQVRQQAEGPKIDVIQNLVAKDHQTQNQHQQQHLQQQQQFQHIIKKNIQEQQNRMQEIQRKLQHQILLKQPLAQQQEQMGHHPSKLPTHQTQQSSIQTTQQYEQKQRQQQQSLLNPGQLQINDEAKTQLEGYEGNTDANTQQFCDLNSKRQVAAIGNNGKKSGCCNEEYNQCDISKSSEQGRITSQHGLLDSKRRRVSNAEGSLKCSNANVCQPQGQPALHVDTVNALVFTCNSHKLTAASNGKDHSCGTDGVVARTKTYEAAKDSSINNSEREHHEAKSGYDSDDSDTSLVF
mmetsp:Transcript_2854/g.7838  ORF Transcript_2854/g.7838 Transcript_2854/m.7838 type:complete len:987 (+) Transcript_2854:111-3071(+)|eukprot:CAMPEP_0197189496 /NCGR_PEP_ID=MMETSP1423-20130617/19830_1 /TAXON_ID=476441 /ORGANISM="Pseudo-nitzschia heimii, Strain UNC1101" /LENGTH=986 /DNA_ID=CAMNT_0042641619 /DNA_START=92 /DNA_END=3052 /DNA_ORIENTATION=+